MYEIIIHLKETLSDTKFLVAESEDKNVEASGELLFFIKPSGDPVAIPLDNIAYIDFRDKEVREVGDTPVQRGNSGVIRAKKAH